MPAAPASLSRRGCDLRADGAQMEDVEAKIFAGIVPVLASGAEAGAEGLVKGLAGAGASVAVDAMEIAGDAANERGLKNPAEAPMLVVFEDSGGVAVDGTRIARAAGGNFSEPVVEGKAVRFADEFAAIQHPDGDGIFQEVAFLGKSEAKIRVILALEGHGARDGIAEAKRNEHGESFA